MMLFLSMNILNASVGTSQEHLVSMEPSPNSQDVSPTSTAIFVYDKVIIQKSVRKNTVKLKQVKPQKSNIKGTVTVQSDKSLAFMPLQPLKKGTYKIKVKPIKLQNEAQVAFKPKGLWQKFVVWICGFMYDDITKCPLCKYVCNVDNYIKTKPIQYTFEVKDDAPKVTTLDVNVTLLELSEHNTSTIKVTAIYDDNTTEDVTKKASYTSDNSSVEVDKGVITTSSEGSALVTVSYGDKKSTVQVEVYEMIDGHLLPHEPDNPDDTLLGVDENNNGVRDDVERWIYKTEFTTHPEINRVIAMQVAKFYQMTLVDPSNKDNKVDNALIRSLDCYEYYTYSRGIPFGQGGKPLSFDLIFKDKYFNTKERLKTYMNYNYDTGEIKIYTATPSRLLNVSYCDENIDVLP